MGVFVHVRRCLYELGLTRAAWLAIYYLWNDGVTCTEKQVLGLIDFIHQAEASELIP